MSGPSCGAGVHFRATAVCRFLRDPITTLPSWSRGLSASCGLPAPSFSYTFSTGPHLHTVSSTFWGVSLVVFSHSSAQCLIPAFVSVTAGGLLCVLSVCLLPSLLPLSGLFVTWSLALCWGLCSKCALNILARPVCGVGLLCSPGGRHVEAGC